MPNKHNGDEFRIILAPPVAEVFGRIAKRDSALHERIEKQLIKLARFANFGKPLRYGLKNQRRLHIGSFVMIYEIKTKGVNILDFRHHNESYKKYK